MNKTLLLIICDFLLLNLIHFTAWDKLAEDSNDTPATGGPVASGTGMGDPARDVEFALLIYNQKKADLKQAQADKAALKAVMDTGKKESAKHLANAIKNAHAWKNIFDESAKSNAVKKVVLGASEEERTAALAALLKQRKHGETLFANNEQLEEDLKNERKANEALKNENEKQKTAIGSFVDSIGDLKINLTKAEGDAAGEREQRIAAQNMAEAERKKAEAERKRAEAERNKAVMANAAANKALLDKTKAEKEAQAADARAIFAQKMAQATRVEADNIQARAAVRIKAADSRAADAKVTSVREIGAARAEAAGRIKAADSRAADAKVTSVREIKDAKIKADTQVKTAQIKADARVADVVKTANIRETAISNAAAKRVSDVTAVANQRVKQSDFRAANSAKQMDIAVKEKVLAKEQVVEANKALIVAKGDNEQLDAAVTFERTARVKAEELLRGANKRLAEKPIVAVKMAKQYYANQVELGYEYNTIFGKPKPSHTVLAEMTIQGKPLVCAITHIRETPFKTLARKGVSGTLGSKNGKELLRINSLLFLSADPRVNIIPVGLVGSAQVRALGVKPYKLATDPFKFPTAFIMTKDGKKYGTTEFEYDHNNPDYVKVDNVFFNFGGRLNPSKGDLVFSRTGDLLGIMANNTYCLVIRNAVSSERFQFGKDDAKLDQILRNLKKDIAAKPRALQ